MFVLIELSSSWFKPPPPLLPSSLHAPCPPHQLLRDHCVVKRLLNKRLPFFTANTKPSILFVQFCSVSSRAGDQLEGVYFLSFHMCWCVFIAVSVQRFVSTHGRRHRCSYGDHIWNVFQRMWAKPADVVNQGVMCVVPAVNKRSISEYCGGN